jgi:hypothetical protein
MIWLIFLATVIGCLSYPVSPAWAWGWWPHPSTANTLESLQKDNIRRPTSISDILIIQGWALASFPT